MAIVKLALKRESDGTPIGHPAATYFDCPCGEKIPVYDRKGNRVLGHGEDLMPCPNPACDVLVDIHGWIQRL